MTVQLVDGARVMVSSAFGYPIDNQPENAFIIGVVMQ